MKVVQINSVCGSGSTGKICVGIGKELNAQGIENYILYCHGTTEYPQAIQCAGGNYRIQALKSRLLGNYGFNSVSATKRLIHELERLKPDIVLLHNLHAHNCHLQLLTDHFRREKTKLVWVFHDCWAFTAYCPHFVMAGCDRWKTGCSDCPQYKKYSWLVDRSPWLYQKKKSIVEGLDLTVVTPSHWLEGLVKESFFGSFSVRVIHNGIDLDLFQYTESDFRMRYHIPEDRFLILGVAYVWGKGKGLDVFVRLSERLDPDRFQIVLVGTNDTIDRDLPKSILSIHRTADQKELAEIYSAADLFVNPTREEVLGLVNIEANACGTPVLTFRTGGSPECIDEMSGAVVACDDEQAMYEEILRIREKRPFSQIACRKRAKIFSAELKFAEYVELLKSLHQEP